MRVNMRWSGVFAGILLVSLWGCTGEDGGGGGDAHFHPEPTHGGSLIELGDHAAHVEFVHDAGKGVGHFYVTDQMGKATSAEAIVLKLQTESGPQEIATTVAEGDPAGSHFMVEHAALKGKEPEGRLTVTLNGKTYNPDLEHDAHH